MSTLVRSTRALHGCVSKGPGRSGRGQRNLGRIRHVSQQHFSRGKFETMVLRIIVKVVVSRDRNRVAPTRQPQAHSSASIGMVQDGRPLDKGDGNGDSDSEKV